MAMIEERFAQASPVRRVGRVAFRKMRALLKSRQALAELDAHLLEDIGVTRAQAEKEARRPLWDVPQNWRQG